MVYRSSRKLVQKDPGSADSFTLQTDDSERREMEKVGKVRRQVGIWRAATIILAVVVLGLVVVVVLFATKEPKVAPTATPTCGTTPSSKKNRNYVDISEPDKPGPFHDLTKHEMNQLRAFLEKDPDIHASPPETADITKSYIYMLDLFPAKKASVLGFLDNGQTQPDRFGRAMMFRGDKSPPVVEEYACGPLPNVQKCELILSDKRRNPVEFSLRPIGLLEFKAVTEIVLKEVDDKLGYILQESYGTSYVNCKPADCFRFYPSPLATNLAGDINKRRLWLWADYPVEYYILHPVDFGVLALLDGSDPTQYRVDKLWYHGQLYNSVDDLIAFYNSSRPEQRSRVTKPTYSKEVYSSLNQRGSPQPEEALRPPTQVEPDGKRYTLKHRRVDYLGWNFNFRMSALTGPVLNDIKYNGQRIAYELSLAEIAVFYSGYNSLQRVTDFVDSGALIGTHSKSLVPGADCPESATFINQSFSGQAVAEPVELARSFCLFENNNGYPLRRHLAYSQSEGAFYGGMMDSVLVLRSIFTVVNYDYVFDFMFHQNGAIETRVMSTGYIFPSFYTPEERPYGFKIEDTIIGNIHHHLFHFKLDLDILGTSNRYETLNISSETVELRQVPNRDYRQIRYDRDLKHTEKEALYKFNFDTPKYHVVHNDAQKTDYGEIKAFRIAINGMSPQLLPEGHDSERTIPWARHQLAVTRYNDTEQLSSSPYAMWDSFNPVTDFTKFYEDDQNIVDQDLVFWVNMGLHHIAHTEDLPLTPTPGNHLTFFLLPYNYFKECPSVVSRDHIRVQLKDVSQPEKGVKVERNGLSFDTCSLPSVAEDYDHQLEENPDIILQSQKDRGIF
jgi:diamine oxidase